MFCPKCGSILRLKEENGKRFMACSCGFVDRKGESGKIKEAVRSSDRKIEVVEEERENILPKTKASCPKCGHDTAYYWLVQTRAGDEPETKFLKCEKCKRVWREYS